MKDKEQMEEIETVEGLAKLLHRWYLEATSQLNKESFNPDAQKDFKDLTEEQKFIDRYIAKKTIDLFAQIRDKQKEAWENKSNDKNKR